MYKYIIWVFICIYPLFIMAQSNWEGYNLQGKVKEYRQYKMKLVNNKLVRDVLEKKLLFNRLGYLIQELENKLYNSDIKIFSYEYVYDSKNRVIEQIQNYENEKHKNKYFYFDKPISLNEKIFVSEDEYKYSSIYVNNKIKEIYKLTEIYHYDSDKKKYILSSKKNYNKEGYEIEDKIFYNGELFENVKTTYDKQNNIISNKYILSNGKIRHNFTYFYNKENKKIEHKYYEGTKLLVKCNLKYDEKGNWIENLCENYERKIKTKNIFIYDSNNNRIREISYDINGNPIEGKIYEIDYWD